MIRNWFVHYKRFGRFRSILDRDAAEIRPLDTFPRLIHLYWDKGRDAAPEIVQRCIQSWLDHNPTWRVMIWDEGSAPLERSQYPADMKTAAYSDMLRLHLLRAQGGVWCDATTFCTKPLDDWLLQIMVQTDFFAFSRPGPDRAISSWFVASRPHSYIISALWRECSDFWKGRDSATRSYFWFHYIFEYLERRSARFRREWRTAPRLSAVPLFSLSLRVAADLPDHEVALYRAVPLHKLTYKRELDLDRIVGLLA